MSVNSKLQRAFEQGRALKIISGLNNFDAANVAAVVKAADLGGATFVDIAADRDLVLMAKQLTNLPICVSAVEPQKFVAAVEAGADLIEIGNFDAFYAQGRRFEASEVLELTRETRSLFANITLSVTVPHILALDKQVQLATELVKAGANIIQTEGGTSAQPIHAGTLGLIEKAIQTAIAKNFDEICFTEHIDYGVKTDLNCDCQKYLEKFTYYQKLFSPQIKLKFGMEFGMQTHTINQFAKTFASYPFDFIILSCHQHSQ